MDEKQKNLFGERDAVLASLAAEEKIIDDELVSTRKKIRNAEDDLDVLNARKKSLQRAVVMISNLVPDGEKEPLTANSCRRERRSGTRKTTSTS
jgi:hypothetical protein